MPADVARNPWTPWARDRIAARTSACRALERESSLDSGLASEVAYYERVKGEVRELVDRIDEIQEKKQRIWKKLLAAREGS